MIKLQITDNNHIHHNKHNYPVRVETGADFPAPIFINIGDVIKIDTRTGDYVERVRS